jgi:hypothetical protein
MKRIFTILPIMALLFIAIYSAVLTVYFNRGKFSKQIKSFDSVLTEREMRLSKTSFSPFGKFTMKGFKLSDKNDFKCGAFMSVNHMSARVSILKLLKEDLNCKRCSYLRIGRCVSIMKIRRNSIILNCATT